MTCTRAATAVATAVTLLAVVPFAGCGGDDFAVDVTVTLGTLPEAPADIYVDIQLFDDAGNFIDGRSTCYPADTFFAREGSTNRVLVVATPDTDQISFFASALDGTGTVLGTGCNLYFRMPDDPTVRREAVLIEP